MIYFCCDDRRRAVIEGSPKDVNGIDFLEVEDDQSLPDEQRQRRLFVWFIKPNHVSGLKIENIRITGGERIRDIKIVKITPGGAGSIVDPKLLIIELAGPGDFSVYTLHIVQGGTGDTRNDPPPGFDPILSEVDFEFKAACEGEFDCGHKPPCPRDAKPAPAIDYLAKDYASFRQLMLDRMSVLMPEWRERHAADLGVTLVELLAYAGDYLSYQQDAIATEAYLGTARRRVSVRRHARLVDYPMHDGTNARVWIRLDVDGPVTLPLRKNGITQFLTRASLSTGHVPRLLRFGVPQVEEAVIAGAKVFELVDAPELLELEKKHNEMTFHTWEADECCLPRGATTADLAGDLTSLLGKIVVFGEIKGPRSGDARDADRTHRHTVRVTAVKKISDPIAGIDVTRIEWGPEDALPFPLCISSKDVEGKTVRDVSVAWGNIVLADHGRTVVENGIGPVPPPNAALTVREETGQCGEKPADPLPARFNPVLAHRDITFESGYDAVNDATKAASALLELEPRQLAPRSMKLVERDAAKREWLPREHLLNAGNSAAVFVVENESDGTARIRFGDGIAGARPRSGTIFDATYRIGNGVDGNIGGDAIATVVSDDPFAGRITFVTNPMPARGGVDPESMERVRQNAPAAFRVQERAVTEGDYGAMAQRCSRDVQRAAATFRWTGSWHTVFVTVDRKSGRDVGEEPFRTNLENCLDRYRMAGHDLRFDLPRFVPLEIEMMVCVKREYFRSDVEHAVREVLEKFFHPDNFTFGQSLYVSKLLAAAHAVEGVDSITIKVLQRQGVNDATALDNGSLDVGALEIIQVENSANFRERGTITLDMKGGR